MQRLEVSGAVRPIYGSLGVKRLKTFHRQIVTSPSSPPLPPDPTSRKKFQGGDAFENLSGLSETRHSILFCTKVN